MQGSDTHMLKGIIDDEASGFFSIALSPDTAIKPKAEFARKADETDQPAIIHSPYRQPTLSNAPDQTPCIIGFERVGRAQQIAQNERIVRQPGEWRGVRHFERPQDKA